MSCFCNDRRFDFAKRRDFCGPLRIAERQWREIQMRRILAMSDIHDRFEEFAVSRLPDAELCIVAGDLTNYGVRGKWEMSKADLQVYAADPVLLNMMRVWQGDEMARAEQ